MPRLSAVGIPFLQGGVDVKGEGNKKQDGYHFEDVYSPTLLKVGFFEKVVIETDNHISEWGIAMPPEMRETLILNVYRSALTDDSLDNIQISKVFSDLLANQAICHV
jgi:hypothetical protein